MVRVESFDLDHRTVKAPYVRNAGIKENQGILVQKFDLRLTQPNQDYLPTAALHSIEHMLATYLRDVLPDLIDISPMGCRTGFYLVLWNRHQATEIVKAVEYGLNKILHATEVIAATEIECGNYRDHSLEQAKQWAKRLLEEKFSIDPFKRTLITD